MVNDSPRETRVLSAVVSLVDRLLDDFDVVDLLTDLTERCADLLDVASAGFLLADPLQRLHLLAATSEQTREVELFQLQAEEGPCVECYRTGQPVLVPDMRTETRAVATVRPDRVGGRLRGCARCADAGRRRRPRRARAVRHPAQGAHRGRSAGRPDPGPHRLCRGPAGTPTHPRHRVAAAARSPGRPRPGRTGQGVSQRDARSVGGRRVRTAAHLQPRPVASTSPTSRGG